MDELAQAYRAHWIDVLGRVDIREGNRRAQCHRTLAHAHRERIVILRVALPQTVGAHPRDQLVMPRMVVDRMRALGSGMLLRLAAQRLEVPQVGPAPLVRIIGGACGANIVATEASIMSGNMSIIGLSSRPPPPSTMSATMPSMATIMTTGNNRRTSGTGLGFAASGTASACKEPLGSGGAGSRGARGMVVTGME